MTEVEIGLFISRFRKQASCLAHIPNPPNRTACCIDRASAEWFYETPLIQRGSSASSGGSPK